jgi:hypothetical protein
MLRLRVRRERESLYVKEVSVWEEEWVVEVVSLE